MFLYKKTQQKIKKIFPEYYPYTARHFCAIARLIRTKIQTKHFDVYEIKEWLGHTKIETTMTYIKDAKYYYDLAPFDWIHRVLKAMKKHGEDYSVKIGERPKYPLTDPIPSCWTLRRLPDSNRRPLG